GLAGSLLRRLPPRVESRSMATRSRGDRRGAVPSYNRFQEEPTAVGRSTTGFTLSDARLHHGLEGRRFEQGGEAGTELAQHLRQIAVGVILPHALEIISGQGGVHFGCGRLPDERGGRAAEMLRVKVPQGPTLAVRGRQDEDLAAGSGDGGADRP